MTSSASHHRPFVLLTGATGLVGGLVLAELLRRDIPVAVLVRANRRQPAADRLETLMQRLEQRYGQSLVRPVILSGELCTPGLGLSEWDRCWITEHCGSVIHSAANLLFRPACDHPHHEPFRTNVDGTRHLLDLTAAAGILEWHYVSTAYIAGLRSGRILETESETGQQFGNDYERSKTMAEQMLRARFELRDTEPSQNPLIRPAATFSPCEEEKGHCTQPAAALAHSEWAKGRPVPNATIRSLTIYRPSIVIDLHPTSSMRSDQTINSAFTMFQALSQRFGLPHPGEWIRLLGFRGDERKNIVTVDWVARMITQIYRRPALHDQTYHLTSPAGLSASELEDGFRAACEKSGTKYPSQRRETAASFHQQAAPFVAAFSPYFRDDPQFDRSNIIRAMELCGESDVPLLTRDQLRDFCLRQVTLSGPVITVTPEKSAWDDYVEATNADAADHTAPPHLWSGGDFLPRNAGGQDFENGRSIVGLMLSGPGGGQWLIEEVHGRVRVYVAAASMASVRWIAMAGTFHQLIQKAFSVSDAIESGRLMLEFDNVTADSKGQAVVFTPSSGLSTPFASCQRGQRHMERLSELIARIQSHLRVRRSVKSEVSHVG